jgi:hypothetical protein
MWHSMFGDLSLDNKPYLFATDWYDTYTIVFREDDTTRPLCMIGRLKECLVVDNMILQVLGNETIIIQILFSQHDQDSLPKGTKTM